jgi:hypothetical protein
LKFAPMANCSIPNSSPQSGRISRKSSRQLRKQNSQPRAAVSVIRRLESRIQKRHRVRHGESVLWRTAALQNSLRAQKIQSTIGNRRSAIWRVKGAWWPSRSSKPPSSRSAGRGRFDSYPLRRFIFDFSIADCRLPVVTALRSAQQLHEGGEPYVT